MSLISCTRSRGGQDTVRAASTTTAGTVHPVTPPGPDRLAQLVVQAADLPPGWKQDPPERPSGNDDAAWLQIKQCVGVRDLEIKEVAVVPSPPFSHVSANLYSQATSYRSQADLEADVAVLRDPRFTGCYVEERKRLQSPPTRGPRSTRTTTASRPDLPVDLTTWSSPVRASPG